MKSFSISVCVVLAVLVAGGEQRGLDSYVLNEAMGRKGLGTDPFKYL